MYKKLYRLLNKVFRSDQLFKYGFNWSPMYRRSVGKIKFVSPDLHLVKIQIPLNYKNVNYAGSIFGGSLFSATDPIYMIQLIQILGDDYVVWDKSASIKYKKPAVSKAFAIFEFSSSEIEEIKTSVSQNDRVDIIKKLAITNSEGDVFAEIEKTVFISTKAYYKSRKKSNKK